MKAAEQLDAKTSALPLVTVALLLAILFPLTRAPKWDEYPISRYPMFSRGDLGRIVIVSHALIVDAEGRRRPASPSVVGTPEPMVAKAIVEGAIRRSGAAELCTSIATRAREAVPNATAVEIVTSQFDSTRYFANDEGKAPLQRDLHASCPVP